VYCRLKKIPCGFKEQARVRHPGEKYGPGSMPGSKSQSNRVPSIFTEWFQGRKSVDQRLLTRDQIISADPRQTEAGIFDISHNLLRRNRIT
jgi:hypothetical protein